MIFGDRDIEELFALTNDIIEESFDTLVSEAEERVRVLRDENAMLRHLLQLKHDECRCETPANLSKFLGKPAMTARGCIIPSIDLSSDDSPTARKRVFVDAFRDTVVKYFLDQEDRDREMNILRASGLGIDELESGFVCDFIAGTPIDAVSSHIDSLEHVETLERSFSDLVHELSEAGLCPLDGFGMRGDFICTRPTSRMILVNAKFVDFAGDADVAELSRSAVASFRRRLEQAVREARV